MKSGISLHVIGGVNERHDLKVRLVGGRRYVRQWRGMDFGPVHQRLQRQNGFECSRDRKSGPLPEEKPPRR